MAETTALVINGHMMPKCAANCLEKGLAIWYAPAQLCLEKLKEIRDIMRINLLLLLVLSLGCQKKAVDFSSLYAIKSRFDQKSSVLLVDISLDKSIHAYAKGEKIGIPIELLVSHKNGWVADGQAELPLGEAKKLSLGESVVLEGNIQVRQKLKKGSGPGEANLHLQVCSENACDRPRIHPLIFQ